jgi:hypothetical protein
MKKVIRLTESDLSRLVKRVLNESHEEGSDRYMFFSNLEQIKRQCEVLLEQDRGMIEEILDNGHDWAQDHIAESKNNMDQVFDFMMGEIKGDGEQDINDNSFDDVIGEGSEITEKKKKIHSLYKIGLADLPISFQMQDINSNPTCWMTSILVDSEKTKNDLRKFLSTENIETRPFFVPLHLIPHFNYISDPLPVSVNISSRGINLPSGTLNYDKNIAFVISKILNYYGKN